jgi:hypothetical protein
MALPLDLKRLGGQGRPIHMPKHLLGTVRRKHPILTRTEVVPLPGMLLPRHLIRMQTEAKHLLGTQVPKRQIHTAATATAPPALMHGEVQHPEETQVDGTMTVGVLAMKVDGYAGFYFMLF